jgi:uncharacterized Zn finger protein
MADEIKTDAGAGAGTGAKVEPTVEELLKSNEDLQKKYEETQANLDRVAAERENYKKVALAKKNKISDGDDGETEDERIARIVAEQLQTSTEAKLLKEKEDIAQRALKENKELKVALQARSQIGTSSAQGGGQGTTMETKVDFWTSDQLAYFKKKGIDPEKAKENYLKIKGN